MSIPLALLRRRGLQVASLVLVLAAAPTAAEMFAPALAPYIPPFVLSLLVILTGGYVLLVWRPRAVVAALFPRHEDSTPVLSALDRRNANISAIIMLAVTFIFTVFWLGTVL